MYLINKNLLTSLPSVAVVILNWNGKHFLEKFLPSVMLSGYENLSVIVADNASTDDSISFLKHKYPSVLIIYNSITSMPIGFSKTIQKNLSTIKNRG